MRILLLEAFYAGSHRIWADGLARHSDHHIDIIGMDGRHWKWRMEHSALYFAEEIKKTAQPYDLILTTDLTNVAVLKGLLASYGGSSEWYRCVPVATYFHENQITYPWSVDDPDVVLQRDNHYGWINYMTCIASDHIYWNSQFHHDDFYGALSGFLAQFPDAPPADMISRLQAKSTVLPIGLDLGDLLHLSHTSDKRPTVIWNHRWEYDKNPESFFRALFTLQDEGLDFDVIIAGEKYRQYPPIFDEAQVRLADRIRHMGFARSKAQYHALLQQSDIALVTSRQDFFGISAIEAMAAGCSPLLPDRLAFSDHLDRPAYDTCYYETDAEMLDKLRHMIIYRQYIDVRQQVAQYDWSQLISQYDQTLAQVCK